MSNHNAQSSPTSFKRSHVIIVGGGWSGLAAACQLAPYTDITLLEAAPQLGGRARAVSWHDDDIDNGQHLFLGAYHHTYQLLRQIGLSVHQLFYTMPFQWQSDGATGSIHFSLRYFKKLPWLSLKGLNFLEKISLLRALNTFRKPPQLTSQRTVLQFLQQYRQSEKLIQHFWQPLCEAALTTPIATAALSVFHQVMHQAFGSGLSASDYWIPSHHLSKLLPEPAHHFLHTQGAIVHLNARVERLCIENNRCTGVWSKDVFYPAEHVILATPYQQTRSLLKPYPNCHPLCDDLQHLIPAQISTLYLHFDQPIITPLPFFHIQGPLPFWVFHRKPCQQPDLLALVFSQPHPLLEDETTLIDMIMPWLATLLPKLPALIATKLIREKRGAFEATLRAEQHRPSLQTPICNVLLAGDYVANGYPACLEGAVLNGIHCSARILESLAIVP